MDSRNVYVASLPHAFTEDELLALVRPFGAVESAILVMDRKGSVTQRCKGYGFVLFRHEASAQAAIDELNMSTVHGRYIQARLSKSPPPQEQSTRSEVSRDEESSRLTHDRKDRVPPAMMVSPPCRLLCYRHDPYSPLGTRHYARMDRAVLSAA